MSTPLPKTVCLRRSAPQLSNPALLFIRLTYSLCVSIILLAMKKQVQISLALLTLSSVVHAYVVNITPGTRAIYLQVGAGGPVTGGGGTFATGGTPSNSAVVNEVSVSVPAATVGAGSVAMTSNSTVTISPYDNFAFCTVPAQVYVGGFFRAPAAGTAGTLTVTAPTSLTNGAGGTIPFSEISWVSGGTGDATPTIPSGTFVGGGPQTMYTVTRNTWFESCLQFNYANTAIVPAGTYRGTVTYTLTAP
jgi:hypothetical protein